MNLPLEYSDHPSLVGILRMPECNYSVTDILLPLVIKDSSDGKYYSLLESVQIALDILPVEKISNSFNVPKEKVTDFYPYTYYVLTDNECEPLIMYPQYLPTAFNIKGKYALSHTPIERYFPSEYKGDTTGNIYNITNTSIMMLPYANNRGVEYMTNNANVIKSSRENSIISNILNGVSSVGGILTNIQSGNLMGVGQSLLSGVTNGINGYLNIKQLDSRNKDILLTPSSISSYGTPSTRESFNTNKVRVLKYTVTDKVKEKIENFVKRYGNKYNNYATIDLKVYKGYLKMCNVDIDSKLDNQVIQQIATILERGVYIE